MTGGLVVRTRFLAWGFSNIEHVPTRAEAEERAAALRQLDHGPEPVEIVVEESRDSS